MCSWLMRLTLWVGLLTMASACDQYRSPTGPSFPQPVVNSSPSPLPMPLEGIPKTVISVGAVIHATIGPGDPICDRSGWDARAPCKLFLLTPSSTGTLNVMLTVTSPVSSLDVIDLMLFAQPSYTGAPFEYSTGSVSATVVEGRTYLIRVNSYPYLLPPPGNLDFELRTEM